MKKVFYFLWTFLAIAIFVTPLGWAQTKPGTQKPIITHSFAVEKGYFGYVWKIYIEAEDPDGDMFKIASVAEQIGYGRYPTDWIILRPRFQKHLRGYVQWNTFSTKTQYLREWTNITLKVSIFDKAGNESNEVVFPFTFESGVKSEAKLPLPFDQKDLPKLGNIFIDLFEPALMGGTGASLEP